jgi:ribosomal protein S18 acetylase RimI-like enzyme
MSGSPGPGFFAVRPARIEDAATIVDFNLRLALETEKKELELTVVTAGVDAILRDPRLGRYFVAVDGDRILGQLMVTEEWSDWRNGRILWLQSVYVDAAARGRGVFRRMLAQVHKIGRSEGVVGIRLYVENTNRRAQETYVRYGFADAGYRVLEQIPLPPPGGATSC